MSLSEHATSATVIDVNATLTPNRPAERPLGERPRRSSRRRKDPVENTDYAAFAARVIRAHGRRIADGDVEGLPELVDLAHELDAATQAAVNGLRSLGFSWAEIASRLGTSRQAAQQRWGR
jgi:hypothetical protein